MSSFQGVSEAIRAKGLFWHRPRHATTGTARGRRQGGQGHPDPGRPRPVNRVDPGLPPDKGALGAAPCRSACPRNSGSPASPTWSRPTASSRGLPATTQRPLRDPGRGPGHRLRPLHRRARRHPVHPRGTHRLKRQRSVRSVFRSPPAATAAIVKARVRVHEYPDGTMAVSNDWHTTPIVLPRDCALIP